MVSIAQISIDLAANSAKLVTELQRTQQRFSGLERQAQRFGKVMRVALAALSTGAFSHLIQDTLNAGDALQKLSIRLGTNTEVLSQYQHIAQLSGVHFNTLTTAWQRMTRRISEAQQDTGPAKDALKELGLVAADLMQLPIDIQFERIADRLNLVTNASDRVRLAMKLFDTEGVQVVQTMGQGAKGLQAMRAEANRLGVTLTQNTAERMAGFNDQMTRLKQQAKGVILSLTQGLLPSLNDIAAVLVNVDQENTTAQRSFKVLGQLFEGVALTVGTLWNSLQAYSAALVSLSVASKTLVSKGPKAAMEILKQGAFDLKQELKDIKKLYEQLFGSAQSFQQTFEPIQRQVPQINSTIGDFDAPITESETKTQKESLPDTESLQQTQQQLDHLETSSQNTFQTINRTSQQTAQQLQRHFSDFLFDPFNQGLQGMMDGFVTSLRRMVAEAAAAQIFASFGLGTPAMPRQTSALTQGLQIFGFAQGGSVAGSRPILVGEQGPEVFIPPTSGQIIPNHQLTTGAPVTVNLHGVQDFNSFQQSQGQFQASLARAVSMGQRNL